MGKVLEVAVKATFGNHVYYSRIYRQRKGSHIGLLLTGVVARVVMDCWGRKLTKIIRPTA